MSTSFNDRLNAILEEKSITQKELAIKAGVTEAAVSHYIKGDRQPRAKVIQRIAVALDTTVDYLMEGIPTNVQQELLHAKRLISRNINSMTDEQKKELINILAGFK